MSVDEVLGEGRRRHYGEFYGRPEDGRPPQADDGAPIAVVFGNCQAESLRIMLHGPDLRTVRIPPVFELVAEDLPHLERLLRRTSVLVSQPVRNGYHDLPLGTAELAALLPTGGRVVRMPVVRFAGLYPFHAIVRPPGDASLVPPVVEYHDLRTVMRAWWERDGGADRGNSAGPVSAGGSSAGGSSAGGSSAIGGHDAAAAIQSGRIREIAAQSIAELQRREVHHDTVVVSDLFAVPDFELMRTINHPGNAIFTAAAQRVRERLSLAEHVVDPGRNLLDSVHAPREQAVIRAFGLDAEPRADWIVGGLSVSADAVERAHLSWYAEHPSVIDAAIARHRVALQTLALLP